MQATTIAAIFLTCLLVLLSVGNFRLAKVIYQYAIRPWLSLVVNYSIYYFRIFVLRQTVQQAKREHYEGYRISAEREHRQKTLVNIAVVNRNLNKYTETFIDQKVLALQNAGYYVHRFYGGDFPTAEHHAGHLLANNELGQSFFTFWETLWGLPANYFLKKAFVKYLKHKRIKLVFAEFGTCGVEIFEQCQQAGVPLVVTFHGYDLHHRRSIEQNYERYTKMFNYCSKVVCVSNDILLKLNKQYGLTDKLLHLPAMVNLKLFKPAPEKPDSKRILYVGRFAETKSPHLVILTFNDLLKQMPDAELVMIGRDGGGELFEACVMLATALKIENKIHFKGILSPEEVYEEMKQAAVFIQYSVTTPLTGDKEGTPVAIREAMATGLPVVATKHAGIEEVIENEVTGILVEEYDQQGITQALLRVLTDKELSVKLGRNAAAAIRNNATLNGNANELHAIVERYRLA